MNFLQARLTAVSINKNKSFFRYSSDRWNNCVLCVMLRPVELIIGFFKFHFFAIRSKARFLAFKEI